MVQCTQPPPQLKLPESKITELTDDENHDSPPKPEKRTRMHHIERHRSCVLTLSDIELNGLQPHRLLQTIEKSPGGSQCLLHEETPTDTNASHRHAIADAAWEALKRSIVYFRGQPIDKSQGAALNYDQVFMRDFIPSALAFLMKGEHLTVKNFLVETACLQSREKIVNLFKLGHGVISASFKVYHHNPTQKTESLLADFGETAIGRVAPVDSGLWWIILFRAYTKWTGDNSVAENPKCQRAMHLILRLCLSEGCDTSPALLCADRCSMIDRRMGIYGYPIGIEALFFMAMRCALSLLKKDSDAHYITKRIHVLIYHLHSDYWFDFLRLDDIYRYKTEEYSQSALNKFIAIPESTPNVSSARMDFHWFCLGNFIAIASLLATGEQAEALLDLAEERWQELIGEMPLKICYPAMDNQERQIVTGCDLKSTKWSYHNGGPWPDNSETEESDVLKSDVLFSEILRKAASRWVNGKGPENSAVISLDDLDEFLDTYVIGIGGLRQYCEKHGVQKDLSKLGYTGVIFTTLPPPGGSFNFDVKYKGRNLTLVLDGKDLYLKGWRGQHGIFELKEHLANASFMSGKVTAIFGKFNYRFLAPQSNVAYVRIGLESMRMAFEQMYKSKIRNTELLNAIATFAVHFAEAGRIQSIFKDVCLTSNAFMVLTLDHIHRYNSMWVTNYRYHSGQILTRISELERGEVPEPIKQCGEAADLNVEISESDILSQIRIFLWYPALGKPKPRFRDSEGKDPKGGGDGGSSHIGGDVPLYLVHDRRLSPSPPPLNLARTSPAPSNLGPSNLGMVATIGRKLTCPRLAIAARRLFHLLI